MVTFEVTISKYAFHYPDAGNTKMLFVIQFSLIMILFTSLRYYLPE